MDAGSTKSAILHCNLDPFSCATPRLGRRTFCRAGPLLRPAIGTESSFLTIVVPLAPLQDAISRCLDHQLLYKANILIEDISPARILSPGSGTSEVE
jgi:hypothetical protein